MDVVVFLCVGHRSLQMDIAARQKQTHPLGGVPKKDCATKLLCVLPGYDICDLRTNCRNLASRSLRVRGFDLQELRSA